MFLFGQRFSNAHRVPKAGRDLRNFFIIRFSQKSSQYRPTGVDLPAVHSQHLLYSVPMPFFAPAAYVSNR